nr:MAG: putative RNA-dependent RNA polymerase [Picobirnavirus sp.]
MEKIVKLNESYYRELFPDCKLQFVELENVAQLPNPGLRSYVRRIIDGNNEIYTTPWIASKTPKRILSESQKLLGDWMPHLDKIKDKWPTLYEFEKGLAAKVGPLSVQKPLVERAEGIMDYYKCISNTAAPISQEAIAATIAEFDKARGLNLRSEKLTLNNMKKSTSSGLPYYMKRRKVVEITFKDELLYNGGAIRGLIVEEVGKRTYIIGAILGWRGQEGGPEIDDMKQRVVWMFPFKVNVEELRVYQPLTEVFQHFNLNPAWTGERQVDESITRLFDSKAPEDLVVCTDFDKFDHHYNSEMQKASKTILEALLAHNQTSKWWLENIFSIKYQIPLMVGITEDGKAVFLTGDHGMGSGSGGTSFDETLGHRSLQHEAALSHGRTLNPYSICLGDDGVLSYPGIKVEDVTRVYTSHGQEMNLSKQYASAHDCVFLRRWHHEAYRKNGICVGVYSTARALGRLMFQERYMDVDEYPRELDRTKMIALRELSIIENCKNHPLFEEFVRFCMARDKFRLGLDIPGFISNISKFAILATDYMPDFLGYTRSVQEGKTAPRDRGIAEWEVVKLLKRIQQEG